MTARPPSALGLRVLALLLAGAVAGPAPAAGEAEPRGLTFGDHLDQAWLQARQREQVLVVYFTARWCPWCRKMEVATFTDPAVLGLAQRFTFVKVDADLDQETAAAFGVRGLPAFVLLNIDGEVVAQRGGYQAAPEFARFLRENADKARTPGLMTSWRGTISRMEAGLAQGASVETARAAVAPVVEQLAKPERQGREELLAALRKQGPGAWTGLAALLTDERLAVRAAAANALAAATGADLPFDAFAEGPLRAAQAAAWQRWVAAHVPPSTQPAPTQPAATQPAAVPVPRSAPPPSRPPRVP